MQRLGKQDQLLQLDTYKEVLMIASAQQDWEQVQLFWQTDTTFLQQQLHAWASGSCTDSRSFPWHVMHAADQLHLHANKRLHGMQTIC